MRGMHDARGLVCGRAGGVKSHEEANRGGHSGGLGLVPIPDGGGSVSMATASDQRLRARGDAIAHAMFGRPTPELTRAELAEVLAALRDGRDVGPASAVDQQRCIY